MKKMNYSKIANTILLAFLTIVTIAFSYLLMNLTLIPFKLRLGITALIAIIYLLFIALYFKKIKSYKLWIYRLGVVALSVALSIGTMFLYKTENSLHNVTAQGDGYITLALVVNAESPIISEGQLKNKKVGVNGDKFEKDNTIYAKKQLNKNANKVEYTSESSFNDLAIKLKNEEMDAMLVPVSALAVLEDQEEGYSSTVKTIKTYKRKVENASVPANGKDLSKETFTILLSGVDTTDGGETSLRSDVVMILIVNPVTNHIEMVSFPRDSYVPNMALGGYMDKLTHTSNNGIENTMKSLEEIIGFELDFYLQVNFTSVLKMVDTLGGVEVDVPIPIIEQNSERELDTIKINPGKQTLDGEQALAYSRHRKSYGDLERTKAQQDVIQAMVKKALSKNGVAKAPAILDIVGKYITTSISKSQISSFVSNELDSLAPWTFGQTTLENGIAEGNMINASSSIGLSCYILSFYDLEALYQKYYMITNPTKFSKFKFNLSDLKAGLPKLKKATNGVFSEDDYSSYLVGGQSTDYEDNYDYEEDTPTNQTPTYTDSTENNNGGTETETPPPTTPVDPPVTPVDPPVTPTDPPVNPETLYVPFQMEQYL